jgi:hypothetical protein
LTKTLTALMLFKQYGEKEVKVDASKAIGLTVNIRGWSCEGDGNSLDLSKLVGSLDMLLCNGLIVFIEFGFDEFRIVVDRAS